MPRIALIHATPAAIDPIVAELAIAWPDAELVNILDDSLSKDRAREGVPATMRRALVPGALAALQAGRRDEHDDRIVAAGRALGDCDAILLAQFSMAPAAVALRAVVSVPVLTSPSSAVATLKSKMAAVA